MSPSARRRVPLDDGGGEGGDAMPGPAREGAAA